MRRIASIVLLASLTTSVSADPPRTAASKARSIDTFSAKLHGRVGTVTGNLIYSPASIAIALAMTREGATGETAKQMDTVLGANAGSEAKALGKLWRSAPSKRAPGARTPPELAIANRLYGDKGTAFVKRFIDVTRDDYGAPLESVDFRKHSEDARLAINKWVEQQTKTRIKDLLQRGVVNDATRLVLVNAIYLKAEWETPFEKSATKPAKFAVEGGPSKDVPTMHGVVGAKWGTHAGARVLDLPYVSDASGPRLSMMVVVPDKAKLAAVEAMYAKEGLAGFVKAASNSGQVDVALPKWKVGTDFVLNQKLADMGMPRAFEEGKADFGGMTTTERLHISKVIHKAWIEVDEKGTEAAAATAVVMTNDSEAPSAPFVFKVDRSFVFLIHDQNGTVLFAGRVADPSKS